jgi:4-alpha-glucanotransferase
MRRASSGGRDCRSGRPAGATRPYQSLSSFAGNGLLISPDRLVEDGLLQPGDCKEWFPALFVDDETVGPYKHRLLEVAWRRFSAGRPRRRWPSLRSRTSST